MPYVTTWMPDITLYDKYVYLGLYSEVEWDREHKALGLELRFLPELNCLHSKQCWIIYSAENSAK